MPPGVIGRVAAAPVLATALLLAGCGASSSPPNGIASRSPARIVAAALAAADGAVTVHVTGSILSEGRPISLNMELLAGKGGVGHIALPGLDVDIVKLDRLIYIRGNSPFYRALAGAAAGKLRGDWLRGPADTGPLAPLARLTELPTLLMSILAHHGSLVRGGLARVGGEAAVAVRDPARDATLYVAATGTPYPLEIATGGKAHHGRVVFDGWNKPVTISPPTNPVDIAQLRGLPR